MQKKVNRNRLLQIWIAFYKKSNQPTHRSSCKLLFAGVKTSHELSIPKLFQYHPDVTGSAPDSALTERFLAIKEAYDVLKDANSRHDYDTHRAQTSSDYTRRAYNSRTYDDRSAGYGTWRSNRYSGSTQFRSGWPYSDAHLKRVRFY